MTTRTEPYACPVCGSRWDQKEQWDEDAQEWKFSDEPYGFCRTCTPEDDQDEGAEHNTGKSPRDE